MGVDASPEFISLSSGFQAPAAFFLSRRPIMSNDPLGWNYPAGAENDPRAPWNEVEPCEDCENDPGGVCINHQDPDDDYDDDWFYDHEED